MPENKRAGLQRVRVGLTGLGAVLLIVAVATAIFEASGRREVDQDAATNRTEQVVANMIGNEVDVPADPLQEIGVTPAAPATSAGNVTQATK